MKTAGGLDSYKRLPKFAKMGVKPLGPRVLIPCFALEGELPGNWFKNYALVLNVAVR